jgi:hypothetical protein
LCRTRCWEKWLSLKCSRFGSSGVEEVEEQTFEVAGNRFEIRVETFPQQNREKVLFVVFAGQNCGLGADPPELESRLGFYDLTVHFEERINEEINRSAFRFRIDHQITTLR